MRVWRKWILNLFENLQRFELHKNPKKKTTEYQNEITILIFCWSIIHFDKALDDCQSKAIPFFSSFIVKCVVWFWVGQSEKEKKTAKIKL